MLLNVKVQILNQEFHTMQMGVAQNASLHAFPVLVFCLPWHLPRGSSRGRVRGYSFPWFNSVQLLSYSGACLLYLKNVCILLCRPSTKSRGQFKPAELKLSTLRWTWLKAFPQTGSAQRIFDCRKATTA